MIVKEHNIETGEVIEREMTANELAKLDIDSRLAKAETEAQTAKAVEKAALLERLGITAEEAFLLLG
jgi:hypothetical protein